MSGNSILVTVAIIFTLLRRHSVNADNMVTGRGQSKELDMELAAAIIITEAIVENVVPVNSQTGENEYP
jgi:hypothetical protein